MRLSPPASPQQWFDLLATLVVLGVACGLVRLGALLMPAPVAALEDVVVGLMMADALWLFGLALAAFIARLWTVLAGRLAAARVLVVVEIALTFALTRLVETRPAALGVSVGTADGPVWLALVALLQDLLMGAILLVLFLSPLARIKVASPQALAGAAAG